MSSQLKRANYANNLLKISFFFYLLGFFCQFCFFKSCYFNQQKNERQFCRFNRFYSKGFAWRFLNDFFSSFLTFIINLFRMFYQENETESAIREMYKNNDATVAFMDELIYGKQMLYFNVLQRAEKKITLYLHTSSPDILIATEAGSAAFVFNLNKARLDRVDIVSQLEYGLLQKHSILIEEDEDQLHLIFPTLEDKNGFAQGFKRLSDFVKRIPKDIDPMIMKNFIKADTNKNLILSRMELIKLLREINLGDEEEINTVVGVENFTQNSEHVQINFRSFQKMMMFLQCRKEFVDVFKKYTKFKPANRDYLFNETMTKGQFEEFLLQEQGENKKSIREIIKKMFRQEANYSQSRISFYQFCQYLMSPSNTALDFDYSKFKFDDEMPLNHYYCFSSHNTYLTGNQLSSDSHSQRYYEDLSNGIRCVQIDCHDGSEGPIVKHGYTATSSISFDSIIDQIDRFCREEHNINHTPIVISLENHCNNENQAMMAKKIQSTFKQRLITIQNYNLRYPSLKQLRGKIIIRGTGSIKIHRQILSIKENENMEDLTAYQDDDQNQSIQQENQEEKRQRRETLSKFSSSRFYQKDRRESDFQIREKKFCTRSETMDQSREKMLILRSQFDQYIQEKFPNLLHKKKIKMLNKLLVKITAMLNCGVLSIGEASPWESISISQTKISDLYYSRKSEQVRIHAERSWVRVYPMGLRFDSSNYDPLTSLEFGAQIIALNTQRVDYYTHIMKKFFMKGSAHTAGYRLKPSVLPEPIVNFNISITPIAASCIYYNDRKRKNQIPPVEVKMRYFGVIRDNDKNAHFCRWNSFTERVLNNGCNPVFKYIQMMTLRLTSTELGFIVMEIEDCGIGVLPIDSIRKGYRPVTLYDDEYEPKESKIICHFQ